MATILKALAIFLTLARVYGQCSLSNVEVPQYPTGKLVHGKPQWRVSVWNRCPSALCIQWNVQLNCSGFQTVEPINPSVLSISRSGDVCLVNGGQPIPDDAAVNFDYAWSHQFSLNPIFSDIVCPYQQGQI